MFYRNSTLLAVASSTAMPRCAAFSRCQHQCYAPSLLQCFTVPYPPRACSLAASSSSGMRGNPSRAAPHGYRHRPARPRSQHHQNLPPLSFFRRSVCHNVSIHHSSKETPASAYPNAPRPACSRDTPCYRSALPPVPRQRGSHALKVFAAHGLVAAVPVQALVASLRGLLARVVELALGFAAARGPKSARRL